MENYTRVSGEKINIKPKKLPVSCCKNEQRVINILIMLCKK